MTIDDELWEEASRVAQAPTHRALIEQGLRTLIDQAARRRAIALGGSMPGIERPRRRKFSRTRC